MGSCYTYCLKTTFLIKQHVIYYFADDQIFAIGITSTATNQICARKSFITAQALLDSKSLSYPSLGKKLNESSNYSCLFQLKIRALFGSQIQGLRSQVLFKVCSPNFVPFQRVFPSFVLQFQVRASV